MLYCCTNSKNMHIMLCHYTNKKNVHTMLCLATKRTHYEANQVVFCSCPLLDSNPMGDTRLLQLIYLGLGWYILWY